MNKSELVEAVASRAGLEKRQAEEALRGFTEAVIEATRSGDKVSIVGFGTFTPTSRAARTGRNPQTGAPVKIAASKGVRFAPGSGYKDALNSKGGAKKAAATKKSAGASKATASKSAGASKAAASKAAGASKAAAKKATKATKSTKKA